MKEKAKELFDKCYYKIEDATAGLFEEDVDYITARRLSAKQCALIAVDEIISELSKEWGAPYLFEEATQNDWGAKRMKFWEEVRAEIESL